MPEAPAEQDQPTVDAPEAPKTDQPTGSEEESFTDSYDPSELPEEARGAYEEAYKRLQGAYTKKTQSLAEERREAEQAQQVVQGLRNPQVAPAILSQLGYTEKEILEMFGYQPEEDPTEEPDLYEEVQGLKQTLAQRDAAEKAAQQEEAVTDYIAEQIEAMEKEAGREFDPEEHQLLYTFAQANPDGQGLPDVKGGYGLLSGILSSREKALLDPKRATSRPPGNGKTASRTVDLSKETPEERRERMAEAAAAAQASQG